ncbi:MAG: hypothetical protein ABI837_15020 [Acidobacteriota bacterium]
MTTRTEWDDLASTKLARVLGAAEGEAVFQRTLKTLGFQHLQSANDVYQFAQLLKGETAIIAAVGAMLSLSAVIKGADATPAPAQNRPRT